MDATLERDRLRDFIDLILSSLNDEIDGEGIASRVCLSRYHFDRLISSAIRESPGAFRRRLLLERAAWELQRDRSAVIEVALDAGYESAAGFTRAFSRAFGMAPSEYRKTGTGFRLSSPNGIHFHPPGGIAVNGTNERSTGMDFVDRVVGHDLWFTERLLDRASTLPGDTLDRPIGEPLPWRRDDESTTTLRELLQDMVGNKENWVAALTGRAAPAPAGDGIEDLRRRFQNAAGEFTQVVRDIRDRGEWDAGFVDAVCDPPQSFTYGGALAHIATFSAVRRTRAVLALQELGVGDMGLGDPIEWERSLAG